MGLESRFFRNPEVAAHRVEEETILAPRGGSAGEGAFFTLNEVGSFVWERLDGQQSLFVITEEIVAAFAVERPRAAADVLEFVGQLELVGCVLEVGPWSVEAGECSRRQSLSGSPALQSPLFPRRLPN